MTTYKDFRTTYAWALRTYPGTANLPYDPDLMLGKVTTKTYHKSGSRWVLDSERHAEDLTVRSYFNCIDAIPFFRALGGSERVTMGYCVMGYVPLKISSISPDRTTKHVREFKLF
jgi:hypothetical protein